MTLSLLSETLDRLFTDHCLPGSVEAAEPTWDTALWDQLAVVGFTGVGVAESAGGQGGSSHDAAEIVRVAARHAAPVPLAETLLIAGWISTVAELELPAGPTTVAVGPVDNPVVLRNEGRNWLLEGTCRRVAWAGAADRIIAMAAADGRAAAVVVDPTRCRITPGRSVAGEPRDTVVFAGTEVRDRDVTLLPATALEEVRRRGAAARSVQMAGALERVVELTVKYATEREQFGRPIGRFQAVQQQIAELAGEGQAAGAAAALVADAFAGSELPADLVATAKIRTGIAAGTAATIAHQVAGAIGFTREYPLHRFTRRLWSWRDEWGSEHDWALTLGRAVIDRGADALWPCLTGRS